MKPRLNLLSAEMLPRIVDEALMILQSPGIKVKDSEARALLESAGAFVKDDVVKIPENVILNALESAPHEFWLYNRQGEKIVHYGGDDVHFDPGSSGINILDPETGKHRPTKTADLVRLVKVTEMLTAYDAQSTAVLCNEIPKPISDLYRLFIVLQFSSKPIVTGSFAIVSLHSMIELLSIVAGGLSKLEEKPQAIFDVCPTPPLIWSGFGAQNLIILARACIPVQIVSMPLAGVAAPITLLGTITQHAAESLCGIAIHQLAKPGAPIVWGGAPSIFDMRYGTTPMGAIETAMIDVAYTQVGKFLGLPTHTYLGASDAKLVDAQAGMESGMGIILGALAGVNMISGAGMLDFLACQSVEKLIIDAEAILVAKRLVSGIDVCTDSISKIFYQTFNFKGDFLRQKLTRDLFQQEQTLPSSVIDRNSIRGWMESGELNTYDRARQRMTELLAAYKKPLNDNRVEEELHLLVKRLGADSGMMELPIIE